MYGWYAGHIGAKHRVVIKIRWWVPSRFGCMYRSFAGPTTSYWIQDQNFMTQHHWQAEIEFETVVACSSAACRA